MIELELADAAATEALGRALATVIEAGDVILLMGDLGAGKTTLVRGLVAGLGGNDAVTSPTFTLRHEYSTTPHLTHVDCWRLDQLDELIDLGLEEARDDGAAIVIEWGELARALFPDRILEVALDERDEGASRVATITDPTGQATGRLAALRDTLGLAGSGASS